MITVTVGDLLVSEAQTLVNTVNTVGIMGKGIAAVFKARYPDMFRDYKRRCARPEGHPDKVVLGKPYLYHPPVSNQLSLDGRPSLDPGDEKWIINFPTKEHWRGASRLDAIDKGLDYLIAHCEEWEIESIAVPPLGCGYGGLEWRVVGPLLYRRLNELQIPVELYAPHGTPMQELDTEFLSGGSDQPSRAPEKVGTAEIVTALTALDLAAEVGVEGLNQRQFRAIAYFLAVTGVARDTELSWGRHGVRDSSFAETVRRLERNGVIVLQSRGRARIVTPGPTCDDARRLVSRDAARWVPETERVRQLAKMLGPKLFGIAPAVHYAVHHPSVGEDGIADDLAAMLAETDLPQFASDRDTVRTVSAGLRDAGLVDQEHDSALRSPDGHTD